MNYNSPWNILCNLFTALLQAWELFKVIMLELAFNWKKKNQAINSSHPLLKYKTKYMQMDVPGQNTQQGRSMKSSW